MANLLDCGNILTERKLGDGSIVSDACLNYMENILTIDYYSPSEAIDLIGKLGPEPSE